MVACYNVFIYLLNEREEILNAVDEMSYTNSILFHLYLSMTHFLILNLIVETIFFYLIKKKLNFTIWSFVDILIFVCAWLITIDANSIFNETETYLVRM